MAPKKRATRAPRGSLSREKVLAAALELAAAGLDAVSMRALGTALGVDPTAVYRYFRTKDELLTAMADAVVASDRPFPETGDPVQDLEEAFVNLRRSLLEHPALVPVVARRPPAGEATQEGTVRVIGILTDFGLDAATAAAAFQALLFYTLGHAVLEAPYAQMDANATELERQEVREDLNRGHPKRAAVRDATAQLYRDMDRQFEYGLNLMLVGVGMRPPPRPA
ncbi:MAG: TetR/AcrR family transcriptional regulator [Mycobacteriaceae bacterium]